MSSSFFVFFEKENNDKESSVGKEVCGFHGSCTPCANWMYKFEDIFHLLLKVNLFVNLFCTWEFSKSKERDDAIRIHF
jgi:hypothetical protein